MGWDPTQACLRLAKGWCRLRIEGHPTGLLERDAPEAMFLGQGPGWLDLPCAEDAGSKWQL